MSLRCYIVDNEDHSISHLVRHINSTPNLQLAGTEINPVLALKKINAGAIKADIIFLDIEMPQLSGLEMAALIQPHTHIVFTTAHADYALKAFDTEVIDYLLKPVEYPRFLKAVQKVEKFLATEPNEKKFIFIQSEAKGKWIRIKFDNIYYIEGAANYIRIYADDDSHLTYFTLKEMEDVLPRAAFLRVHRSYLVNVDKISFIEGSTIHMDNGTPVQLGAAYKKEFLEKISSDLIRSNRQS